MAMMDLDVAYLHLRREEWYDLFGVHLSLSQEPQEMGYVSLYCGL